MFSFIKREHEYTPTISQLCELDKMEWKLTEKAKEGNGTWHILPWCFRRAEGHSSHLLGHRATHSSLCKTPSFTLSICYHTSLKDIKVLETQNCSPFRPGDRTTGHEFRDGQTRFLPVIMKAALPFSPSHQEIKTFIRRGGKLLTAISCSTHSKHLPWLDPQQPCSTRIKQGC